MIALPLLLLVTAGTDPAALPAIVIDPCVDVDLDEVQRLTGIELSTWQGGAIASRLDVAVACTEGAQELRVTDRTSGHVTMRSIDLNARFETDRDARARELALAIAELIRRVELEAEPTAAPAPEPKRAPPPMEPGPPTTDDGTTKRRGETQPWRAELAVAAAGASWTGGEVLLGVDAIGRFHLSRRLIADVRLGARRTRPVVLQNGKLDASGAAAALGVSVDLTPSVTSAGVAVGARLGGDWLRYVAVDAAGGAYGRGDAGAVSASGDVTGFVRLSDPVCLVADAALGGALHSIAIEDNGRGVSGLRGVLFSGALGVAAQF
jgi:hypothetical protein